MKKITTIIGSPRKGNTLRLVEALEHAISSREKVEFTCFHLSDLKIEPCRGCMLCLTKGFEHCPIDDDVKRIDEALNASDGIILASPVYVMHITSQMKSLIDRLCYMCHRPSLCHAHAMAASTTGAVGIKKALSYLTGVLGIWGCRSTVSIGIATPPVKDGNCQFSDSDVRRIDNAAVRFIRNLELGDRKPVKLSSLIQFRMQRMIFTADETKAIMPADFDFYSMLVGKDYFSNTKISAFKRFTSWLVEKAAKPFI